MSRLVSVAEFQAAIPVGVKDDNVRNIFTAIGMATLRFASLLKTNFDRGSRIDYFLINPQNYFVSDNLSHLLLSNGFLVTDTLEIRADYSKDAVDLADPVTTGISIDLVRGIASYWGDLSGYKVVKASYQAGFTTTTNTITLTAGGTLSEVLYASVPSWLKSAVIAHAHDIYKSFQTPDPKNKKDAFVPSVSSFVHSMLAPYARHQPHCLNADISV